MKPRSTLTSLVASAAAYAKLLTAGLKRDPTAPKLSGQSASAFPAEC
jgi:hypothetical protein